MSGPDGGRGGCERVRARLELLVDGALAPLAAARDEGHLEACAACRGEKESVERLVALLRAPEPGLDAALAGLAERLSAAPTARRRRRPRPAAAALQGLLAAAACLAALALVPQDGAGIGALARTELGAARRVLASLGSGLEAVLSGAPVPGGAR